MSTDSSEQVNTGEHKPAKELMSQLLVGMSQLNASDLHLKVNYPAYYRIAGHLRKLEMPPIDASSYLDEMLRTLVPPSRLPEFDAKQDLDFSSHGPSGDRFRINVYRSTGETHAAIRRVQSKIPSFEELCLPAIYQKVALDKLEGLVLVSGVTGSGKSSTLAAMIQHINDNRSMHIVTIEDPIEFIFHPKKSIVSQREIGIDVPDYHDALRMVVRQDPDCILIGEMRDRETMAAALQAAETGHLVFGTLHCSDAQQSFARILEFFPQSEHAFVRSSLANSLAAIMVQRLLPGIEQGSRYPATEVLLNNGTVRDKIVREEDEDIPAIISQSVEEGMRSFTTSLCELVQTEKVHYDTAMDYAPSREALASAVKGIKTSAQSLVGRMGRK
ncbi:MAG: type IV pilus twitching motility protein PilT [Phycisphaerae bacterium]